MGRDERREKRGIRKRKNKIEKKLSHEKNTDYGATRRRSNLFVYKANQ